MSFRLECKQFHLTYRGHLDFNSLKEFIINTTNSTFEWYSIVHENGHQRRTTNSSNGGLGENQQETPGSPLPNQEGPSQEGSDDRFDYEHTHFAFCLSSKLRTRNQRIFDFEGIHPHIRTISKPIHARRIFWEYHHKEPVRLEQSSTGNEPQPLVGRGGGVREASDLIKKIKAAPSIIEAAEILGIEPTCFSDVHLIRTERQRPKPAEHTHPDANWTLSPHPGWRTLFVWGDTNTGKTTWAVHQFEKALLVSHQDMLRAFDPDIYDGIIFDDMSFDHWPAESAIHLLDWDFQREIHCRYTTAIIPARTRKIFCSNKPFDQCFPSGNQEQFNAMRRRVSQIIQVRGPTYSTTRQAREELPSPGRLDSSGSASGHQRSGDSETCGSSSEDAGSELTQSTRLDQPRGERSILGRGNDDLTEEEIDEILSLGFEFDEI